MRLPNFCGGSYRSQSATVDQERTVNLYPERTESPGATSRMALYPTPGVETIVTFSSVGGRAHIFIGGREFLVVGAALVELDSDGAATHRNPSLPLATDTNPATISSNGDGGDQLFITSGGNGYLFILTTNVFSQITALDGKATMGDQLDGYFLAIDANTGTMYSSNLLDGATWTTGVMFAQRNAAPDPWIALKVLGPYIWLFGEQTSEVWYDAGAAPFPFAKHPSGLIQYGISAPFSVTVCDTSLCWLGGSKNGRGFVLRASGFAPEVVSTYAVQFALNGYQTISDGYGDSYNEAGHTFYVLSLPTANKTWVFDLQMSQWHERGTWSAASLPEYSLWRPRCHAFAFGEHRWLDISTGAVYRASLDYPLDVGGLTIRRLRRAPCLMSENERQFFGAFELDLEPGLGTSTGQGANPQVMMRMSRDGGKTWGPERWRSAGKIGKYGQRTRWERLGEARCAVFEVAFSDPIPWRIADAYVTPGQGSFAQQRTA